MRSREVERLLTQASKLTPSQKRQLLSVLSETDEAARVLEVLESRPVPVSYTHLTLPTICSV